MRFIKGFLCASAAVLATCACGRSVAQIARHAFNRPACQFKPMAGSDAVLVLGLNLDKSRMTKIAETFVGRMEALARLRSANAQASDRAGIDEFKGKIEAFMADPFKDMPADFLAFADEVGLRKAQAGWAVLSVADLDFEERNGKPDLKGVPEMALAVATDIDLEKVVAYFQRQIAEGKIADVKIEETRIAGERAWRGVPKTRERAAEFAKINLDPCYASLDGQLVLCASSQSALEKQIRLYREGRGRSRLLRDFKPANGDIASLEMQGIGDLVKKIVPDQEARRSLFSSFIPNGDSLLTGLETASLRLSMGQDGDIAFSMKVQTASAEDADNLRTMAKMGILMLSARFGQKRGAPRQLTEWFQRWRIGGTEATFEASHSDVLTPLIGVVVPKFLKYRTDSQANACISNMKQLKVAAELHYMKSGKTPTLRDLCGPEDTKYLRTTPTCPKDHSPYAITLENGSIKITCGSGDPKHVLH